MPIVLLLLFFFLITNHTPSNLDPLTRTLSQIHPAHLDTHGLDLVFHVGRVLRPQLRHQEFLRRLLHQLHRLLGRRGAGHAVCRPGHQQAGQASGQCGLLRQHHRLLRSRGDRQFRRFRVCPRDDHHGVGHAGQDAHPGRLDDGDRVLYGAVPDRHQEPEYRVPQRLLQGRRHCGAVLTAQLVGLSLRFFHHHGRPDGDLLLPAENSA